jgi:hypothetical protein
MKDSQSEFELIFFGDAIIIHLLSFALLIYNKMRGRQKEESNFD